MNKTSYIIIILLILVFIYIYFNNNNNLESFACNDGNRCIVNNTDNVQIGTNTDGSPKYVLQYSNSQLDPTQIITINNIPEKIIRTRCYNNCMVTTDNNITDQNAKANNPDDSQYYTCPNGKVTEGCRGTLNNYLWGDEKNLSLKSYEELGFGCDITIAGKNYKSSIPIKYNNDIISCASNDGINCLKRANYDQCRQALQLVPALDTSRTGIENPIANRNINTLSYNNIGDDGQQSTVIKKDVSNAADRINNSYVINCNRGKSGLACTDLFNNIGLSTFADLGYSCSDNIANGDIAGKVTPNFKHYEVASYDGGNIFINNCKLNQTKFPTKRLNNYTCTKYTDVPPNTSHPNICYEGFKQYNLFPSTNPLTIQGYNIHQNIQNNITDPVELNNLYNNYSNIFKDPNANYAFTDQISNELDKVLENYPQKYYCCTVKSNNSVKARVPLDPTLDYSGQNIDYSKYNFQFGQIPMNKDSCPVNLSPASSDCDDFMAINCKNIINYMKEQDIDIDKNLPNYAPECACYAPKTESQDAYPDNTPPLCYKDGCLAGQTAYVDPVSRIKTCDITVCKNVLNAIGITAGKNVNITANMQNNCGKYLPSESSDKNTENKNYKNTDNIQSGADSTGNTTSNTTNNTTNNTGNNTNNTNNATNDVTSNIIKQVGGDPTVVIIITIVVLILCSCCSSLLMKKK
jgi:hypothetical protein